MCGITGGTNVAAAQKIGQETRKGEDHCHDLAGYCGALFFHIHFLTSSRMRGKIFFLQNRDICYIMNVTNERKG